GHRGSRRLDHRHRWPGPGGGVDREQRRPGWKEEEGMSDDDKAMARHAATSDEGDGYHGAQPVHDVALMRGEHDGPIPDPGLPEHEPRPTDVDPKLERRAERQITAMFLVAGL